MPLPPGITPRPYQTELFHLVREAFRENQAVLAEAPTGAGKSILLSMIVDSFQKVNKKWKLDRHLYFLVDENFLLDQFSGHLEKWFIPHDLITSGKHEGRPVNIHVCTVQSLRRRPPKNPPAFFIVDEAHFSTSDQFMDLFKMYPKAKILGVTASPETGSGKGLSKNSGNGIFDIMIESPISMRELTELGYLAPVKYYGVPMEGIEGLHMAQGDYKPGEVEKLLQERGTFGDAIKEMQKFPEVQSHIIFFCKSVRACYDMETILQAAGYTTEVLEGRLGKKQRREVMRNFKTGKSQVLITCKMVLKGVDLPWLLMGVDLAPTASRGTQRQKVGRLARAHEGKPRAVYLDMVGNHRLFPNSDIYAKISWRFDSQKNNKKPVLAGKDNTCPLCYAVIPYGQTKCPDCGADKPKPEKKPKKEKHLDGDLVEIEPVPLSERTGEDRMITQNKIAAAVRDADISALIEIGKTVTTKKRLPFWIYYKLNTKNKIVDIQLLYRIQRQMGYKPGWVQYAKNRLKGA